MVRWRSCLVLAVLLLLPRTGAKLEDDDDEDRSEDGEEEEDDDDDDDDDDERSEKQDSSGRRAPSMLPSMKLRGSTKAPKKLPLECFVCAYKSDTPLRSCLDPVKFRVHSVTCHNVEDKCFTAVISKGKSYEAIVRGCRNNCVGSADTTCCELSRCNGQAFAMPVVVQALTATTVTISSSAKSYPPNVVFFVTILLVLQTVVKVSFV